MEKHSVSRLSYLFAHLYLLSSYSFSSDLLSSNLPLLSASALLCFSSLHIVGSLTSKLPSIIAFIYLYMNIVNTLISSLFETKTCANPNFGQTQWVHFRSQAAIACAHEQTEHITWLSEG